MDIKQIDFFPNIETLANIENDKIDVYVELEDSSK